MCLKVPSLSSNPVVSGLYSAVRFAGSSTKISTGEANQVERLQTGNPQLTVEPGQIKESEVSEVKHLKAKPNNRVICAFWHLFFDQSSEEIEKKSVITRV